MPPQTFLTIATFPGQVIEFSCSRCALRRAHSKTRLARSYGSDFAIPDLVLALSAKCPLREGDGEAPCGAGFRFPGMSPLAPRQLATTHGGKIDGKIPRPPFHPDAHGRKQRPMR
jgi:hypothetical protein